MSELTNEDRIDFLVKTGKLGLLTMASTGEAFNPTIVYENMDGEVGLVLLAGGLGEDFELLIEGLTTASMEPQAMISLTADAWAENGNGRTEALQVIAAFAGDDDVVEVLLPYKRQGKKSIRWGTPQYDRGADSVVAGGLRTAVSASHARMA